MSSREDGSASPCRDRDRGPRRPEDAGGVLYVLSAPSGAGKTSLVRALVRAEPSALVSVSHTTRARRAREVDGEHYHFVARAVFEQMRRADLFLEHAEVFGNLYGTSRPWVEERLAADHDVILEIDWQGAGQVKARHPCVSIFVLPPSLPVLEERLRARAQDDEAVIARRLAAAVNEMRHFQSFDYLVINDSFEQALADLRAVLRAGRLHQRVQRERHRALLDGLLGAAG